MIATVRPAGRDAAGRLGWPSVLLLLVAAVALRAQDFGNPVVHIDEQFYLLVGERMLHGAVPYVDIWDRKPIGLFLLYALIRAIGGHGVLGYQLTATAFAWLTAVVTARLALLTSGRFGAAAAGLLYLMLIDIMGGQGGQAPVFYNLIVATAALLTARIALRTDAARPSERWAGAGIMLLLGVGMQIKYNVMFEGMGFGLVLLWSRWRRGAGIAALVLDAAIWMGCALLPTVAAFAAYAAIGRTDAFVYANFISILQRAHGRPDLTLIRFLKMAGLMTPFVVAALLTPVLARPATDERQARARRLAFGWFAVAGGAVLLFGTFFNHYALPLMAPAVLAAAPTLGGRRAGRLYAVLLLIVGLVFSQYEVWHYRLKNGAGRELALSVAAMSGGRNCPYVYDGYPAVYYELDACFPTVRPFPAHQQQMMEAQATGVDQTAAVAAIMARRPDRVMTREPASQEENLRSRKALYDVLDRDYRRVLSFPMGRRSGAVYRLKPGITPLPNAAAPPPPR